MSFRFDTSVFGSAEFNEKIREKLSAALNPHTSEDEDKERELENEKDMKRSGSTTSESGRKKKHSSIDILKNDIIVEQVDFPSIPTLEILDLDVGLGVSSLSNESSATSSMMKGICKIAVDGAMLKVRTVIESNLLLLSMGDAPDFVTPGLVCNDSFSLPITMTFSHIKMEAISKVFFVARNSGIGISFDDVVLDFKFDCSIKMLQSTIEKRLKTSMELVFKETLPTALFNMSQTWFTKSKAPKNNARPEHLQAKHMESNGTLTTGQQNNSVMQMTVYDESDLHELSPPNMLRLSTLVSSRQTLSLYSTVSNTLSLIPGCLERQNLYRFISRMPSLGNYYSSYSEKKKEKSSTPDILMTKRPSVDYMLRRTSTSSNNLLSGKSYYDKESNLLPTEVLEEKAYDLDVITEIQNKLYERSSDHDEQQNHGRPRRRKIKMQKSKKTQETTKEPEYNIESIESDKKEDYAETRVSVSMPFVEPSIIIEHDIENSNEVDEIEIKQNKRVSVTEDDFFNNKISNSAIFKSIFPSNGPYIDDDRYSPLGMENATQKRLNHLLGLHYVPTPPPPPYY